MSDKPKTAAEYREAEDERPAGLEQRLAHAQQARKQWVKRIRDIAGRAEAREDQKWLASDKREWDEATAEADAFEDIVDEAHAEVAEQRDIDAQREPFKSAIHGEVRGGSVSKQRKEDEERIRAFLNGDVRRLDVSFEGIEMTRDDETGKYEIRDLSVGVAASGGTTVPSTFATDLYRHLVDSSGIRRTNVSVDTTPTGSDKIYPKTISHGTASIVGEGTALPENDPTFGAITLGSWKYSEFFEVTNELVTDTGVDLLTYLAEQSGRAIGLAQDADFFTGSGTNEPTGAFTVMGTAVTGATGGTGVPSVANLIDLFYSVNREYRERGYWVMRDATAAYIRKLTAASSAPEQWAPSLQAGQPDSLLGRPVVTAPRAPAMGTPAMSIGFGDWSAYQIRDVNGVRFERSDDYKFNLDVVAFRAILRSDGDLKDLSGALKAFAGPST